MNKDFYPDIVSLYQQDFSCEQIARKYNCSHENIRYILKKENVFIPKFIKSKINLNFLLNYSEQQMYFLGLLLSDGHIDYSSNSISIKLKDTDRHILEDIAKFIGNDISINTSKERESWIIKNDKKMFFKSSSTATLRFNSKEFVQYLSCLGITPNKTDTLIVPKELEQDCHFWRGMIDGDGCIYQNGNNVQLTLIGTKDVCIKFKQFCLMYCGNIKSNIRAAGKVYTITITSTKAVKILDILYNDCSMYLKRKYDKYINVKNTYCPDPKRIKIQ